MMAVRKSSYVNHVNCSCSDSSTSSSTSSGSDPPLKRFNRLLRKTIARRWPYIRRESPALKTGGRSNSDAGLCSLADNDPDLDFAGGIPRRSLQPLKRTSTYLAHAAVSVPKVRVSAAGGGSSVTFEDHSDGSDAERSRRNNHHYLRVPTPVLPGQANMELDPMLGSFRSRVRWVRRDSLPLATIRRAWLKGRESISHEGLFGRRQSTGNFASGGVGAGGCGAPRSAPATPFQLDPPPRTSKHDKQVVKPLSSSVPSVRAAGLPSGATGSGGSALSDASESKAPSKARQKKFFRHFPQVPPDERVLNYYSCALVGDILLQGHLYITKNYFAFYSNVFGYVTKLLIPTSSVLRVTKEKMARIIPNAVGVCTRDERHVFGSLMSRDSTHKLMTHVWKAARAPELATPPPSQDLRISEAELDASEYSPEDESSSGAGEDVIDNAHTVNRRESEAIIAGSGTAIIQPALLTGGKISLPSQKSDTFVNKVVMIAIVVFTITAIFLGYKICAVPHQEHLDSLSGDELYSELMRWQARLHGRAASELQAFLSTNLMLLTKVRQSLEALSGVILTDISQGGVGNLDVPNDTTFS